jgi:hypothetical protein
VLSLVLSACGGSGLVDDGDDGRYRATAENLIEVDLAPAIGLGPLDASCGGANLGPGSTFECQAEPAGDTGEPVRFLATIDDDGVAVDVASTNLLLADQVAEIEATAASVLAPRVDWDTTADHVECADRTVVVGPDRTLRCVVIDPGDPDLSGDETRYPASVVIEDFTTLTITVTLER